ncbi:MAG TPA: hypothetical protein VKG25_11995 [Bryobacteraceae bacterium]|nr:hypothetical protein [Bryobacteraceae bacterium]
MSTKKHGVLPAVSDPIRIVPLHTPKELSQAVEGVAAAPPPHLSYRGGPLMTSVEIFTVFWGKPWTTAPLTTTAQNLNKFFQFIVTSPLIDQLMEYSVPQFPIGHGSFHGTATITAPALGASVSDSAIQHMLNQEISTNPAFPQPGPNILYFVYLPPGVIVVQGGSKSCQAFCGYHNDVNGQIFYAAMPYANCNGCLGGLSTLDALTGTSSHEMCEAITDPIPGRGWYDDVHGEIGDICAWNFKKLGAYNVQLEWSNKANKCV